MSRACQRRQWHSTPILLPGKSHGWRGLVGCSPWGREESGMTEQLYFHFSLSCIGEGNGKPLQCSCLENPRDGGTWCAAVYGVPQSLTWLKRLSSSSSSSSRACRHVSCESIRLKEAWGISLLQEICCIPVSVLSQELLSCTYFPTLKRNHLFKMMVKNKCYSIIIPPRNSLKLYGHSILLRLPWVSHTVFVVSRRCLLFWQILRQK